MDTIDELMYAEQSVDKTLANAYREIFNGDCGKLVLEDLMKHCLWGQCANNEFATHTVMERQTVIWRIKKMLNAKPENKQTEEDTYE